MRCDAVLCDWNGTLIDYRDERPLLYSIAVDVFKASVPFYPLRMARILKARRELEALYLEGRRDDEFDFVRGMFGIYNEKIIRGLPVSLIHSSVDRYARKEQTQDKLDHRVLRTIRKCHRAGMITGIFSAGYRYGIERILAVAGHNEYFDFFEADYLKEDSGKAVGFGLNIYKNKPELLRKLLDERNMDAAGVAYIGDSEDDQGCFKIVGYPVVAFFATEEVKERCARESQAFVPKDEGDLTDYLTSG
ncbi:MAG: HAD family hydrolase [Dehalococcoidia bacterium]